MPLNKEMLFGLAFGDNDMTIVPNKNSLSQLRGNNTPYTFSTPIIIIRNISSSSSGTNLVYTITYPDGSSLTVNPDELNLEHVYYPADTTIEFKTKSSKILLQYIESKYV